MLPTSYFVNISTAERKSTGQSYRLWLVQNLIDTYSRAEHNIVESSHILFDAARIIGIHTAKVSDNWEFTSIRTINVEQPSSIELDEATQELQQKTSQIIKKFQKEDIFTCFGDFKVFWCAEEFKTTQAYLDAFYRYIPYAKLGIDEEPIVKEAITAAPSILQLGLARQRAVINRVKTVFQSNIPKKLPSGISESLIDYAVRTGEDNIPLQVSSM